MHKLKDNTLITGIDVLGCSPIRKNDFSRVQLCSYDLIKSMKNTKIELKSLLVYLFPFFLLVISRLSLILFSVWKWKKEVSCLLDSIWIPNWHLSGFGILWILNTGLTPIIYRYFFLISSHIFLANCRNLPSDGCRSLNLRFRRIKRRRSLASNRTDAPLCYVNFFPYSCVPVTPWPRVAPSQRSPSTCAASVREPSCIRPSQRWSSSYARTDT